MSHQPSGYNVSEDFCDSQSRADVILYMFESTDAGVSSFPVREKLLSLE